MSIFTGPRRRSWGRVVALGAVLTMLPTAPAVAEHLDRVGDADDLVLAAVDISRRTFGDGQAAHVVLGRDDLFADSLAGSALAGKQGPILFSTGGSDASPRQEMLSEVRRVLGPGSASCAGGVDVFVLGGPLALSERTEQAVLDLGYCVQRLFGETRVETSVAIADHLWSTTGIQPARVLVARADNWADAAPGGAHAAATGFPIVVTHGDTLHPAVADYLARARPGDVVLLGGVLALSSTVERQVQSLAVTYRAAGAARDGTAVAIADMAPQGTRQGVTLVNGYRSDGWAYALAAGPRAARHHAPLLYTEQYAVTDVTAAALAAHPPAFVTAVGPRSVVDGAALDHAGAWADVAPQQDAQPASFIGSYDLDGDGTDDTWAFDDNFDGYVDQVAMQLPGWSWVNAFFVDSVYDGVFDRVGLDRNGDGAFDVVGLDTNGDRVLDWLYFDDDYDGVWDGQSSAQAPSTNTYYDVSVAHVTNELFRQNTDISLHLNESISGLITGIDAGYHDPSPCCPS